MISELAEDKEVEHAVRSRTAMLPGQVGSLSQRPPEQESLRRDALLCHYVTRSLKTAQQGAVVKDSRFDVVLQEWRMTTTRLLPKWHDSE